MKTTFPTNPRTEIFVLYWVLVKGINVAEEIFLHYFLSFHYVQKLGVPA